jgi:hypothetical protein
MPHTSFRPPETTTENPARSPGSAGSAWAREKRFADVLGHRMECPAACGEAAN